MAPAIVQKAEALWETWDIRVCILASFFIQASLTFLAPWRKSRSKLGFVIWLWYLLADSVALYAIGLISNSPVDNSNDTTDLLVFWSPFLLVHLGGPDTITALALEDNELWLRHLLQLATQASGTIYLLYRTRRGDKLLIPTVIMFVAGFVKYLERTTSLYMASMDRFRDSIQMKPDSGPNYATLMEEYASRKMANIPVYIKRKLETTTKEDFFVNHDDKEANGVESEQDNTDSNSKNWGHDAEEILLVKKAYDFYLSFRGLIVDIMFSFKERTESRHYFLRKNNGKKAFKVVQIELNFIYDVFFTKVNMLQEAYGITRIFSFSAVIASLLLFYFKDKHNYLKVDVYITYVLLGGALVMDVVAVIMLYFSDWAIVAAANGVYRQCKPCVSTTLFRWWLQHRPPRWSEKISQYDLLYYCLNDHPTLFKIVLMKSIKDVFTDALYVSQSDFEDKLGDLVFEELHAKTIAIQKEEGDEKQAEAAKKASEARGNLVFDVKHVDHAKRFYAWTIKADYDESLLLWHIATDLCISNSPSVDCEPYRGYSKRISDYMMYLLITQPTMTSAVAGIAQVRFQDTCEEAKKFIHRKLPPKHIGKMEKLKRFFMHLFWCIGKLLPWVLCGVEKIICCFCCFCYCCLMGRKSPEAQENKPKNEEHVRVKQLCEKIVEVDTEWEPMEVKGDRSKSVLFDACRLAKELKKLGEVHGENVQWELTFKVWVELLCYASSRCTPTTHVQQLRRGGELITLVWLLMAHLGLGEQFRINKGTGWARLIVHK